uniref:Uncharacterized protein n=1 Tax=Zea mays TaxID=4577 RepID=C0PN86_MAIZE|nr:unknown [Zea mays]
MILPLTSDYQQKICSSCIQTRIRKSVSLSDAGTERPSQWQ